MGITETTTMTGYERLTCTLEHREPDRVPFDLGGTMVSGINIHALRALRAHLGLEEPAELADEVTQMGRTQDDLADALKIDVRHVRPMPASKPRLARHLDARDGYDRLIDEFGMGWQMPMPGGHYYDLYFSPLKEVRTVKEIEDYPWPDPLDDARYVGMKEQADHVVFRENTLPHIVM